MDSARCEFIIPLSVDNLQVLVIFFAADGHVAARGIVVNHGSVPAASIKENIDLLKGGKPFQDGMINGSQKGL